MELGLGRYTNMDGKSRLNPADMKDIVMDVFYDPKIYSLQHKTIMQSS
jgi:hypothetical protein